MSKWITHRRPTEEDAYYGDGHLNGRVYVTDELGMTRTTTWTAAARQGLPWQPFHRPAPYVKPKRYVVQEYNGLEGVLYEVYSMSHKTFVAGAIETREAAERIAAIYEEYMS